MNKKLLYKVKINNFEDLHVFLVETPERKTLVGFALPKSHGTAHALSKGIRVVFVKVIENKILAIKAGNSPVLFLLGKTLSNTRNYFYSRNKTKTSFFKDFSFLSVQKTRAPSCSY